MKVTIDIVAIFLAVASIAISVYSLIDTIKISRRVKRAYEEDQPK